VRAIDRTGGIVGISQFIGSKTAPISMILLVQTNRPPRTPSNTQKY